MGSVGHLWPLESSHCSLTDSYTYSSTTLLPCLAFREDTDPSVPAVTLFALGIVFWSHNKEPGLNSSAVSASLSAPSWVVFEANVLKLSACLRKTNEIIQCAREILGGTNRVPRYCLTRQILPSVDSQLI